MTAPAHARASPGARPFASGTAPLPAQPPISRRAHVARFLRFALVGGSGVLVDMAFLFLLSDPRTLGLGLTRSKVIAAELAMVNNFLWNDAWTFRDLVAERGKRARLRRFLRFNLVCGAGLVL